MKEIPFEIARDGTVTFARSPAKGRQLLGVSVATVGEALGHETWIDEDFVNSLAGQINNKENGIKARFGHPSQCADGIGTEVGRFSNARVVTSSTDSGAAVVQCLCDFKPVRRTPYNSAMIDHIFALAKSDHDIFGTSIVFSPGPSKKDEYGANIQDNPRKLNHETISQIHGCDFVSDPACNPGGLYSDSIEKAQHFYSVYQKEPKIQHFVTNYLKNGDFFKEDDAAPTDDDASYRYARRFFASTATRGKAAVYLSRPPTYQAPDAMKKFDWQLHTVAFITQFAKTKKFKDLLIEDGSIIRTPSETPMVGDPVILVDAAGNQVGVPEDGKYVTTTGETVVIAAGIITEWIAPMAQDQPAQDPAPAAMSDGDLAKQLAQLNQQMQEIMKKQFTEGVNEKFIPVHGNGGRSNRTSDQDILDGMQLLSQINSKNPGAPKISLAKGCTPLKLGKYTFSMPYGSDPRRRFTTGQGVDFANLLERYPEFIQELFFSKVIVENIADKFEVETVEVGGNGTLTSRMVIMDDMPVAGDTMGSYVTPRYLRPGIGCNYDSEGQTIFRPRDIIVRPYHWFRQLCPREWGNFMDGKVYVNDEKIPFESVILAFIMDKIANEMDRMILMGDMVANPGVDIIDGLLTIIKNDPNIPLLQAITGYSITTSNAVTNFNLLHDAVPTNLYGVDDFVWMMPMRDPTYYFRNFSTTLTAAPYNTNWEKPWVLSNSFLGEFLPTIHMPTNTHVLMPRSNILVQVGRNPNIQTGFEAKEGELWFKLEGHIGLNYKISQYVTYGAPVIPLP